MNADVMQDHRTESSRLPESSAASTAGDRLNVVSEGVDLTDADGQPPRGPSRISGDTVMQKVCENDGSCIQNEKLCAQNEEFCIKMMDFAGSEEREGPYSRDDDCDVCIEVCTKYTR